MFKRKLCLVLFQFSTDSPPFRFTNIKCTLIFYFKFSPPIVGLFYVNTHKRFHQYCQFEDRHFLLNCGYRINLAILYLIFLFFCLIERFSGIWHFTHRRPCLRISWPQKPLIRVQLCRQYTKTSMTLRTNVLQVQICILLRHLFVALSTVFFLFLCEG